MYSLEPLFRNRILVFLDGPFGMVVLERHSLKDRKSNFGPLEIDFWFLVFLDFWKSILDQNFDF